MKIRIKDNSVRLRLTQSEVRQLDKTGIVRSFSSFGQLINETLAYSVSKVPVPHIDASYQEHEISIQIPEKAVQYWANSTQVSLRFDKKISATETLNILVEKDFKCLTERPDENESDLFPNPNGTNHDC